MARVDGDGGIEFAGTQRAAPHGEEQDHDEGAQEGAEQARGEGTEERHGREDEGDAGLEATGGHFGGTSERVSMGDARLEAAVGRSAHRVGEDERDAAAVSMSDAVVGIHGRAKCAQRRGR